MKRAEATYGQLDKVLRALGQDLNSKLWYATVQINPRDFSWYSFHDQAKLFGYIAKQWGDIVW